MEEVIESVEKTVAGVAALLDVITYIRATWINSSLWPVESWNGYCKAIRTNKNVEGWHLRLNSRAKSAKLSLYKLIRLLFRENSACSLQVRLLSDGTRLRAQRESYAKYHVELFKAWDSYKAEHMTLSCLTKRLRRMQKAPQ